MKTICAVMLLLSAPVAAMPCAPSPEVQAALEAIEDAVDPSADPVAAGNKRLAPLRALAEKHPTDPFVVRALHGLIAHRLLDSALAQKELEAAARRGVEEAYLLVLEGQRLQDDDRKAAEAKYRAALAKDGKSWAAHQALGLLLIKNKQPAAARPEALAVLAACPDEHAGYDLLARLHDKTLATRLKSWRARLERRTAFDRPDAWELLWEQSFHVVPPTAAASVRAQVKKDVERLRAQVGDHATQEQLSTLAAGYKSADDEAGQAWVVTERARLFPGSQRVFADAHAAFHEAEGEVSQKTPEAKRAAADKRLATARQWVKAFPEVLGAWTSLLRALRQAHQPPMAELDAAVSALRRLDTHAWLDIADAYYHFNTHLAEVPELARKGVAYDEREHQAMQKLIADDPSLRQMLDGQLAFTRANAAELTALVELRLGHKDKAVQALGELERVLGGAPAADADDELIEQHKLIESAVFHVRGHLALASKNAAEALACFLHAAQLEDEQDPPEPDDDDNRTDAEAAWKALGGTPASFALLPRGAAEKKAPGGSWKAVSRPMPAFALTDLKGKTWRNKDLKGKTVVLSAWATWCEPCKQELPEVLKLHERLKGRRDAVVISFNLDDDIGVVAPFVKKRGIGYPVLLAGDAKDLLPKGGIPYTAIIDASGQVRAEEIGFDDAAPAGAWVQRTLEQIEAAK